MLTFTYDVPLNAVGTTVIVFPSLVSEQEFQDILRHPLPSLQQTFSPTLESWVPILSEVKCADINSYGSELSGAFTGHCEDALPIFDKDQGKALDSSRELFAIVRAAKLTEIDRHSPSPSSPVISVNPAYDHYGCRKVSRQLIWTEWFMHRSAKHWGTPPPDCPSHIENNTLFVLVNPDIEADIQTRRPPEVVSLPPKLSQCITVWIWKESLQEWQIIEYGDVQIINGERMALSLDGTSGLEPHWILDQSLKKKGYKRAPGKRT
ncbi:hypothetical protein BDP27DRAFT_1426978 [Rhodocollybia butyracea]|uniref:Uncharacterized protein n=1 Tax=Rhodocollybia butyracea TaxID=206335 RepID=A0A9P5PD15_9AGAR|nr:hypothetical protein BDP27DRAFT_1426978 [Rhodocollybia butyracea]